MAAEFDLTPPEVQEPTFFDNVLRYGLFLAAIFQIVCILSILLPSKSPEPEWEQSELKPSDITKKQKPTTPSTGKKAKKESKKKR
ncbi:protein MANBAL [Amblyraja radiata]|uniref:protein MANBAL n=1 Tax=Amblyraja radiata TaxID=386614 RepID=UPI0014032DB2|nr:protein MANBAL [Amblyraja radiata]XP_032897555.1 protein MANBAL [Amblyraja radiata]